MEYKLTLIIALAVVSAGCGKSNGNAPSVTNVIKGSTSKSATSVVASFYKEMGELFGGLSQFVMPSAVAVSPTYGYYHQGSVTGLSMTVYKIYFSSDAKCGVDNGNRKIPLADGSQIDAGAPPVLVADYGSDGISVDLAQNPQIADLSGVTPMTVNCVIFEVANQFAFVPDSTAQQLPGCADGQRHTVVPPGHSTNLSGVDVAQTATSHAWVYMPTQAILHAVGGGSGYYTPSLLPEEFSIPPKNALTFYMDPSPQTPNSGAWDNYTGVSDWDSNEGTHVTDAQINGDGTYTPLIGYVCNGGTFNCPNSGNTCTCSGTSISVNPSITGSGTSQISGATVTMTGWHAQGWNGGTCQIDGWAQGFRTK
jgi:hypothetical protein